MSNQRLFVILFIFLGVISLAVWGILTVQFRTSGGQVFRYSPAGSGNLPVVRLHRRSGRFILIDTETAARKNSYGRVVYNPLVLTEEKLLLLDENKNSSNPWLSFQGFYLDYYSSFYCRRFDECNLKRYDREVQLAYEYWRENPP